MRSTRGLEKIGVYALVGGGLILVGGMFVPPMKNPQLAKIGMFLTVGGVLAFVIGFVL